MSPEPEEVELEPWEESYCRYRSGRLEQWTGRVVLNGCLVILISMLGGITLGELIWLFLRFLDGKP